MITLRDYQQKGVNDVMNALIHLEKKSVILECPTGGGKTIIFSYIVQRAEYKGSKILILTDREELLRGTGGTLINFGVNPEYIRAGRKFPPDFKTKKTVVAMAQTLKKRLDNPKWQTFFNDLDLIIIDECHKQEFNIFFEDDIFKSKTVIGFSATPKRGGKQRQLGLDFEDIIHTLSVPEMIDREYLVPDLYYGFESPDMKGVAKNSKGDYAENAMFKKYDNLKTYSGAIKAYKEHAPDTINLVFCTNIIHCVRTCKAFCDAGIPAKFISSKLSKPKQPEGGIIERGSKDCPAEWVKYYKKLDYYNEYIQAYAESSGSRSLLIEQWKAGEFKVMINAGILTTGFDFPAIETITLLRATISEVLYLQMLGRGSRLSPGKTHFNFFDFGDNAKRLGSFRLPRQWHLWHDGKGGGGVPPMKLCGAPGPDEYNNIGCGDFVFASAKICPICGYIFPKKEAVEEIELQLMELKNGKYKSVKPLSQMNYAELDEFRSINKYHIRWLYIQLYKKGGFKELENYCKFKGYSPGKITKIKSFIPGNMIQENKILSLNI